MSVMDVEALCTRCERVIVRTWGGSTVCRMCMGMCVECPSTEANLLICRRPGYCEHRKRPRNLWDYLTIPDAEQMCRVDRAAGWRRSKETPTLVLKPPYNDYAFCPQCSCGNPEVECKSIVVTHDPGFDLVYTCGLCGHAVQFITPRSIYDHLKDSET